MAEPGAGDDNDELTVYVQNDTLQRTTPWVIRDYAERGALTKAQKAEIAARFELSTGLVEDLSRLVGNSLDKESATSLARVSRCKAVMRGRERLEEVARIARRIRLDRASIEEHLARLSTDFDETGRAAPLLQALKDELRTIRSTIDTLEAKTDEVAVIANGVAELAPDDRRKTSDMRRVHVVRSCCYIFEDADRPVSYTTVSHEPGQPQRRGPLIDLVNAVTLMVTDPPTTLSDETVRRDIDLFKKLRREGRI